MTIINRDGYGLINLRVVVLKSENPAYFLKLGSKLFHSITVVVGKKVSKKVDCKRLYHNSNDVE